ncbi:hypothetical protein VTL71DRAFT_8389 [Oculimacula yallundae]|uniref:Uncharacterized protein n=1 Tax=Oculimacula yallundae TaxID=86028 RepID=A0ABR4CZQ4_9HELO
MANSPTYTAVDSTDNTDSRSTREDKNNDVRVSSLVENEVSVSEDSNDKATTPPKVHSYLDPNAPETTQLVKWGINWLVPVKMLALFIGGSALAVGHHCYYQSLVDTRVSSNSSKSSSWDIDSQEWKIRFGTAFAFLAKTFLAAAVSIAYKQHIWATCRRKAYSIAGLDALFSATADLFAFTSSEFTIRAKVSAVLAALDQVEDIHSDTSIRLMPLSALITPATLTVVAVASINNATGQVPQLDFPSGNGSFRFNLTSNSVYKWNDMSSALLTRVSFATASGLGILPMPAQQNSANSTWTMKFHGPSLKCETANSNLTGIIDLVIEAIRTQIEGNVKRTSVYTAFTTSFPELYGTGDYNFTKFVNRCILGGDVCNFEPGNFTMYQNGSHAMQARSVPLVMRLDKDYTCALRNTTYLVRFRSSTEQTTLEPISFELDDSDPSNDLTYAAIGMSVAKILTGTYHLSTSQGGKFQPAETYLFSARTSIGSTAIMGVVDDYLDPNYSGDLNYIKMPSEDLALTKNMTLGDMVEELSRNITLSLFSSPRFWSNSTYQTEVTTLSQINIYAYNARNLWAAYGSAIFVTFLSILVGFRALLSNGISYETSFSTIVATTRNRALDDVMVGSSTGAQPLRGEVLGTKLRFGGLAGEERRTGDEGPNGSTGSGIRRAGFGIQGQVVTLRKNEACY